VGEPTVSAGRRRVAIATAAELPDLDDDGPALLAALAALGVDAEPAVWDDPDIDWGAFDLVVIRSTWDYVDRYDQFLAWLESDKRYLAELTAAGLPVVPTTWAEPGQSYELPPGEIVVKPAVSAGSRDTSRYLPEQAADAREHVDRLLAEGRTVMLQPYVSSVDARGETALLYLGGEYSHAIRKGPLLTVGAAPVEGLFAQEDIQAREATPIEREVGDRALAAVPGGRAGLRYARVDLVEDDAGDPIVLEVELTEPSLFLDFCPGSVKRLAAAIAGLL
jgi:hypothetical protein